MATNRRRQYTDLVSGVFNKYGDIEKELEGACEIEDFEKEEIFSERFLTLQNSMEETLNSSRGIEAYCDAMVLKIKKILELWVALE